MMPLHYVCVQIAKRGALRRTPPAAPEMHTQGIEPWSQAWKACMIPLHYVCCCSSQCLALVAFPHTHIRSLMLAPDTLPTGPEHRPPSSVGRAQGS